MRGPTGTWRERLARCHGAAALELALGVGVLVLPVAMMVATFPTWAERAGMARVAAQEAARAAAGADDAAQGVAAGEALAVQIAANHGVASGDLLAAAVTIDVDAAGDPDRDGSARATVEVRMPLTALPFIGQAGGFGYTAHHVEPIERYRSMP